MSDPPPRFDENLADYLHQMKSLSLEGQDSDEKLVIALDFGTTFSGIAYCFLNQRNAKIASILDWPGAEGESVPKIPTRICYDPETNDFNWGALANRMENTIVGVKLLLDPQQERPLYLPTGDIGQEISQLPKPPVNIAADFIGALYQHALNEIAKQVPVEYMDMCQKQFVLSVPAIWSDTAKYATVQAAKQAGLYPVTLIKEPEAAALYTMHSLDFAMKEGDAFIVCDAGGGTVDLISYEVAALTPNLQLKELVPGTGGMAGSLGLNQRFVETVKNLVGEDQFHDLKKTKGFWLAEKAFDKEVKKAFRGRLTEEFFINFPMASLDDNPDLGLESNTWRITGKELSQIFAPLITNILRLIDDQIKSVQRRRPGQPITGIFLVGGFGSSQYLRACVARRYLDIQVLQPNDAWGAIAKGAVLSQLEREATVTSASFTKHYGVDSWETIDPIADIDQPTKIWRDGTTKVKRMTWYIKKGDDIARDQKIRFSFYREFDKGCPPTIIEDSLVECADTEAPRHPCKGRRIGKNCTLITDLRSVDRRKFKEMIDYKGRPYQSISYDLVVTLKSALMEFSMEIDGVQIGTVEARYGTGM
uniref:Actin-like ATPase domain-containing protein n=1 Tax=Bionectria ochroleuca TaxID=29856 RepID=A0A0B7KQL2_BIOOC